MTWFKVDDSFYDHPKVFDLPDSAVALWTRAGCWSARNLTDGVVPARLPARLCDDHETAVRALVDSGLWRRTRGGYQFHDWAEYQPSRDEVTAERARKSSGGKSGNHRRWHVEKGVYNPDCSYCRADRSKGSDTGSDSSSDKRLDASLTKTERRSNTRNGTGRDSTPQGQSIGASDNRSDTDRTDRDATDSEANPPVPSRPDPTSIRGEGSQSSSGSRRATENDDDDRTTSEQTIDRLIVDVLLDLTGRTVTDPHAARVRRQLLDGRQVANPMAYVAKCLRERPNDYLPADTPADRPPPPRPLLDPERAQAGAAEARRLLAERRKADA